MIWEKPLMYCLGYLHVELYSKPMTENDFKIQGT